ncbi:MAG: proline--tRNA ligase [Pseudomonadota bacterium]
MRQSTLLVPTLKEDPADAETAGHRLMLRSGLIRQLASGLYSWLPLGVRVLRNIERIIREELAQVGAQELIMPVVQPAELWQESKRWDSMGPEMLRITDRHERDFCLGPTHEEVITDIFRREVQSYRSLPINLFQIQTKFRDEIRPRFGVMRAREFTMKDGYSFHLDQASFDATYDAMYQCYGRILKRMQLDYRAVEADTGNIGGANSHEFHVLAEAGEDTIAYAETGSYAANLERATAAAPAPRPAPSEALTKVPTPGQKTIAAVAQFLDLPKQRCVKTLVVAGVEGPIALVLRGDHDLNEIKAAKLPGVSNPLQFINDDELRALTGADAGSIGPVGLALPCFVDRDAAALADFVCGANENDQHYTGVNWDRDESLATDQIADLRTVVAGDPAPDGSGPLSFLRGIEVGHIFQLGTKYTETMGVQIQDADGRPCHPIMGCYGMGVTRLVAAVIEQNHDDSGICWPHPLAPFSLHLLALNYGKSDAVRDAVDALYETLIRAGVAVLLDDRNERPGVKFADADLLGLPLRVTIGDRGLKDGQVEFRRRLESDSQTIPVRDIADLIVSELATTA